MFIISTQLALFLNVPFSARAEVIGELCVPVMQLVILRLIATMSGLGFFFILHNRFKTCRIHEVDVGFGGFPCLFVESAFLIQQGTRIGAGSL